MSVPFLVHPVLVAFAAREYTSDEDIIVAAILHDTIEDCGVTTAELTKIFNKNVSRIVKEVSAPKTKEKNWKRKKERYLKFVSKASKESLLIVGIDKMLNMEAYFESIVKGQLNPTNNMFGGAIEGYFWYYDEILKIIRPKLKNSLIVKDYQKKLNYYKTKLVDYL